MALPDEVVLYDLPWTDDPDVLVAMVADPQARWYAKARLAGLAVKGMVAATWNPLLHPRGRDGKFIEVWGFVRWLSDLDGSWRRGQVTHINPETGQITGRSDDGGVFSFSTAGAREKAYTVPPTKARMLLPDPKAGADAPGFFKNTKPGEHPGSNPGGFYQASTQFGSSDAITPTQYVEAIGQYGLTVAFPDVPDTAIGDVPADLIDSQKVIIYDSGNGVVGLHTLGDNFYIDANGEHQFDPMFEPRYLYVDNDPDGIQIEKVWGELREQAKLVSNGDRFFVKSTKSPDHFANEVLANRLYELAGVNVPEVIPGPEGEITLASKMVTGKVDEPVDLRERMGDPDVLTRMHEDFIVDAWLANWDVAGLNLENTKIVDDEPYRIDAGGALLYRAQGGAKGSAFGPVVGEIDSMRDKVLNPQAAKVFGDVTDAQMADGAKRIAAIHPESIIGLTIDLGLPTSVADTIIARRAYILDRFGVDDPHAAEPDDVVPAPAIADTPEMSPDIVPATPGLTKQWDTIGKSWMEVPLALTEQQDPIDALEKVYANPIFQPEFSPSWTEGETLYVRFDGQLHKVIQHKGGDLYHLANVHTGTFSDEFLVKPLTMRHTEDNDGMAQHVLTLIDAHEAVMWERSITDHATTESFDELFKSTEIGTQPVDGDYDYVHPPRFNADVYLPTVATNPAFPLDVGEKYSGGYLYAPDSGMLYQILNQNEDGSLAVENSLTGVAGTYHETDPDVYLVSPRDHYSMEVIQAKLALEPPVEETPGPPGVADPTVVAWLDEKKAIEEATIGEPIAEVEVPEPEVPAPEAPSTPYYEHLTHAEMKHALLDALTDIPIEFTAAQSVMAAYEAEFQTFDGQPTDSNYETFENWVVNNGESFGVDLITPVGNWLADNHGTFVEEPGDLGKPTDGDKTIYDKTVPYANDAVGAAADSFNFGELADDAAREAAAKSLIGKVIFVNNPDKIDADWLQPDGSLALGDTYGLPNSGSGRLYYVEGVNTETYQSRLNMRRIDGTAAVLRYNSSANLEVHTTSLTVDDIKGNTVPTLKKNGDIVRNGEVIGAWVKDDSYYHWNKKHTYTIFAEHSINGHQTSGSNSKMTTLRQTVAGLTIPKAVPVKATKSSPAVKKVVDDSQQYPGGIKGKYTYADGTPAKHGDWVKSTKGGGGFVGKIVGWPDQDKHPGLAFAVSLEGIQKAVNLQGMKKVDTPADTPGTQLKVSNQTGIIPSDYVLLKLADGKTPEVGQKVQSGKPGTTQVTGIVVNINPKQGFIYILDDAGKKHTKTFSATKVLEEPSLVWELPDAAVGPALVTTKAPKPKPIKGYTYPGPDGALIAHMPATEQLWLDANPKRALTKDGYAPTIGLRVRNKAGDELVVTKTSGDWEANPNRLTVWNLTKQKTGSASTTTVEVDHAAELTGYDDKPLAKVSSLDIPGASDPGPHTFLDGSVMYRLKISGYYYSYTQNKSRAYEEWQYVVVTPSGSMSHVVGAGYPKKPTLQLLYSATLPKYLKQRAPSMLEKVAVFDQSATDHTVSVTPFLIHDSSTGKVNHNIASSVQIVDLNAPSDPLLDILNKTPTPTPAPTPTIDPQTNWPAPLKTNQLGLALEYAMGSIDMTDNAKAVAYESLADTFGPQQSTMSQWEPYEFVDWIKTEFPVNADKVIALVDEYFDKAHMKKGQSGVAPKPIPTPPSPTPKYADDDILPWSTIEAAVAYGVKELEKSGATTEAKELVWQKFYDYFGDSGQGGNSAAYWQVKDWFKDLPGGGGEFKDHVTDFLSKPTLPSPTPTKTPTPSPPTPTPPVLPTPTPPPAPNIPTPTPPPAPVPDATGTVPLPTVIPQNHITTWTPPPQPKAVEKKKAADPPIPQVTDQVADLAAKPVILDGTKARSVSEAAARQLEVKDSTDAGTATTYAMGDTDLVEDMAVRFNVEIDPSTGEESLVARFRLREDPAEALVGNLVTSGEGKTGAWKLKGKKVTSQLLVDDLIAVYISSIDDHLLKPENPNKEFGEPNAKVIGPPILVGKSAKSELPLYRVPVMTQDGTVGEVDMEERPDTSISTYEYDPDAPVKSTGKNLQLTATAIAAGWTRNGKIHQRGTIGQVYVDAEGKTKFPAGVNVREFAAGSGGYAFRKAQPDGASIDFQAAHVTESGTGFETTRRANYAGEVRISVPIKDGQPEEQVLASVSHAMEAVGVPVEKQTPPTNEQLVNFALSKVVTNYHPAYNYRPSPITGPDDPRVGETLAHLTKHLQEELGRNVTLDDIRIHTYESGRVQVTFSPEVAKAITKDQGTHHYHHTGASADRAVQILGGPNSGLMSADERLSLGILTSHHTPIDDLRIGGGDRVFVRTIGNSNYGTHDFILNGISFSAIPEVYTKNEGDGWGRRTEKNQALGASSSGVEYVIKRTVDPEQITFYIAGSDSERLSIISQLKDRGVTEIGGRDIHDIVVTKDQAKKAKNFEDIGLALWEKDIPITKLMAPEPETVATQTELLERTVA